MRLPNLALISWPERSKREEAAPDFALTDTPPRFQASLPYIVRYQSRDRRTSDH